VRFLLSGGSGRLGRLFVPWLEQQGHEAFAPSRAALDWSCPDSVMAAVTAQKPDRIVMLAAWTDVSGAQAQPAACVRDTVLTTQHAIAAAKANSVSLLYVSTDYVHAVLRQDTAGVYAAAKLVAEQMVLLANGHVARVAFTTPEQVAEWRWVNDYSKANRCWVEDLIPMLGLWASFPTHQLQQLVNLGGPHPVTPAELLASRHPDHPALRRVIASQAEAIAIGLPAQPHDTCWRKL
jgi:hypothetical protein